MIIERLYIEGYGIFYNKGIKGFSKGLNILYGMNEAGKSTLLDFIRMTLFGYPRQHKDRRPPLRGGNHGGSIWLRNSQNEPLQIYRSGSGRNGFKVFYKNREHADEQLLKKLMDYASEDLYHNIYAITLEELKSVDQLKQSGVEDKIFSVGMGLSGVDFAAFEKELEEHSQKYFKPGGKTQILIELVNEIEDKQERVNKLKKKLEEYNRLNLELEDLNKKQKETEEERRYLRQQEAFYSSCKKAYPHFVEYKKAREQLESLGEIPAHPLQVLEDYKKLKQKEENLRSRSEESKNKISSLEKKRQEIEVDEILLKGADIYEYLNTNVNVYEKALEDKKELEQEVKRTETGTADVLHRLGDKFEKEKLLQIDGTIELANAGNQYAGELVKTDSGIERARDKIRELEAYVESKEEKIGEIDRQINEQPVKDEESLMAARESLADMDTRFKTSLSAIQSQTSGTQKYLQVISIIFSFIFLGSGFYLVQHSLAAGIAVGFLGAAGLAATYYFSRENKEAHTRDDPETLNREMEALKKNIEDYLELYKKKESLEEAKTELQKKLDNERELLKDLEKEKKELLGKWREKLESFNIPNEFPPGNISDLIREIDNIKRFERQKSNALAKIEKHNQIIWEFEESVATIKPISNIQGNLHKVHLLIKQIGETINKADQKEKLSKDLEKEKTELKTLENELNRIEEEKEKIFKKLNVENETELYRIFEKQEKAASLENELKTAEAAVKSVCGHEKFEETLEFFEKTTPESISVKLNEYREKLSECEKRYSGINTQIGSTTQQINDLLKPDEMFDLQNQIETLKTRLREETNEWLATKMALEILSESKQRYEEEKQPAVITTSRDYFSEITASEYTGLKVSLGEKHVSLKEKTGKAKSVGELSRGTREQLLLALRMGLISEYEKNAEPLPVVLDDVMVNFDPARAKNTASAMSNFARSRQVLIFTCHPSTVKLFEPYKPNLMEW